MQKSSTTCLGRPAARRGQPISTRLLRPHGTGTKIARLPPDQAEIIVLRIVVGLDAKTVAKVIGKRPGAVHTAAHRGLRRLEQLLNDLEHPQ